MQPRGMFGALKDRHGAAALSEVKRQYKNDERRAAEMMADGNFHDALGIYERKGAIHWTRTQGEARAELVEQWARDSTEHPDKTRFVFAYTNAVAAFDEFRHGYAGTIYRGQGKTLDQTYLYHSEHLALGGELCRADPASRQNRIVCRPQHSQGRDRTRAANGAHRRAPRGLDIPPRDAARSGPGAHAARTGGAPDAR